jgi:hypothetical protein
VLLDRERLRPAVLDRVAQTMQRAHPGLPPQENTSFGTAHADELIVKQVRRHLDEGQPAPLLADDLMSGGIRDEMGEPSIATVSPSRTQSSTASARDRKRGIG